MTPEQEKLIVENLILVDAIAASIRRSLPVNVEISDLRHAGVGGLIGAAMKYDSGREASFPTYAKYRISGSIRDHLRSVDDASRGMRLNQKALLTAINTLREDLGREPTDKEVMKSMGVGPKKYQRAMMDSRSCGMLAMRDSYIGNSGEEAGREIASKETPELLAITSQNAEKIKEAMSRLSPRLRLVINLCYYAGMNLRQIAEKLGVNESRACQLRTQALEKLRDCSIVKSLAAGA